MKTTKRALWALILSLALFVSTLGTSTAALVSVTKVMVNPITWVMADDKTPDNTSLTVYSTTQVFLSSNISDDTGQPVWLDSMSIIVTLNDVVLSRELYSDYAFGGKWSRVGICVGGTDSYLNGSMRGQGGIATGLAVLDSSIPYTAQVTKPGDVWKATTTWYVVGQDPVASYATVTNPIPEPGFLTLVATGSLLLLRRRK